MSGIVSIAIETSCRAGGVALGLGDQSAKVARFDASRRAATQIITHLDALLVGLHLSPSDLEELYVSIGPGSFTGLRVGVTVARTLAQAIPRLRCVAVPTPSVIAENARSLDWENLGVILDCKQGEFHASLFCRRGGLVVPAGEGRVVSAEEFLAWAPRPILLIGEGLGYHELLAQGVGIAPGVPGVDHLPSAEGVWRVGRRMASRGEFTDYRRLLPTYARNPEAVRLWNLRHGDGKMSCGKTERN